MVAPPQSNGTLLLREDLGDSGVAWIGDCVGLPLTASSELEPRRGGRNLGGERPGHERGDGASEHYPSCR